MAADFVTGLDIGTSTIKAALIARHGKLPKLISFGSIATPQPGMVSDSDADLGVVSKGIKKLLDSLKIEAPTVVSALPESKIFTRIIDDLPYLSDEELSSAIKYSIEEFVPLPADQVNLYWQVLDRSKPKNHTVVFVVASPKNTVNKYLKVLHSAGIMPMAIETELVAATRSLVGSNIFAPTTMVVQLGAASTDFAVVSRGMIFLTRSISTGGLALTRAISQYLNFEITQAEEYKRVYGLMPDQLGGKIYQVIQPIIEVIMMEATRVIQAFQAKNPQNPIKRVVLTGGGAKMPGMVIYFANRLGLEIQEADPLYFLEKDPNLATKIAGSAPHYTVSIGLALWGI